MAFKMRGFPKIGNPKDFARQQKLKAGKLLKTEDPETVTTNIHMDEDPNYELSERIANIKETANREGRDLTNAEKADIASMKKSQEKINNHGI